MSAKDERNVSMVVLNAVTMSVPSCVYVCVCVGDEIVIYGPGQTLVCA